MPWLAMGHVSSSLQLKRAEQTINTGGYTPRAVLGACTACIRVDKAHLEFKTTYIEPFRLNQQRR